MNTVHYICGIDFEHEMEDGCASFYTSIEELKAEKYCWRWCGIMEVVLDGAGEVVSSKFVIPPEGTGSDYSEEN